MPADAALNWAFASLMVLLASVTPRFNSDTSTLNFVVIFSFCGIWVHLSIPIIAGGPPNDILAVFSIIPSIYPLDEQKHLCGSLAAYSNRIQGRPTAADRQGHFKQCLVQRQPFAAPYLFFLPLVVLNIPDMV